jgi:2-polyprenyl-3-methyl-5-hydroxy-6-metoxy-1,4-benzoquinol methylase
VRGMLCSEVGLDADRGRRDTAAGLSYRLVSVPCNLCGATNERVLFEKRQPGDPFAPYAPFRYVECAKCGLVYINPRPCHEDVALMYADTTDGVLARAYAADPEVEFEYSAAEQRRRAAILRSVGRPGSGGKLLDVGCASGPMLRAAENEGWEATGVEISEASVGRARLLGLNAICGTLEDAAFPDNAFDAALMIEVLDHLEDPVRTLTELHRVIRPGGAAYFGCQNLRSFTMSILKARWKYVGVHHLYYFTPKTMRRMAETAGFRVARVNYGTVNPLNVWRGLRAGRAAEPDREAVLRTRARESQLRENALVRAVLWGLRGLAVATRRGESVYVTCVKPPRG